MRQTWETWRYSPWSSRFITIGKGNVCPEAENDLFEGELGEFGKCSGIVYMMDERGGGYFAIAPY